MDNASIKRGAVEWMLSHVGLTERPANSNIVPLDGSTLWQLMRPAYEGGAWCAAAVTYAYWRQGVDLRKIVENPFYCPNLEAFAKSIGAWRTAGSAYGDLVLFDMGHQGLATHVGISIPDTSVSGYKSVEGNTSAGSRGSQENGGGLYVRVRPRSGIRGWVDMGKVIDYAVAHGAVSRVTPAPKAPVRKVTGRVVQAARAVTGKAPTAAAPAILRSGTKGQAVRNLQAGLKRVFPAYAGGLDVDSEFGPATAAAVKEFQSRSGLLADGEVGPATVAALRKVGVTL